MARQVARSIDVFGELADGHWACLLPVDVLNEAVGKGLCRVVETGAIYETDSVPVVVPIAADKKFVAARVVGHRCWLTVRVAGWSIVANHGDDRDAAHFDASLRNGES